MSPVPIISLFNNKGGVGKTTFLFHIAHALADRNIAVLMVDCDSQCNLTAYALHDKDIEASWGEGGNSIYRSIELVARGLGDITPHPPTKLSDNLYILPGDLFLSDFEDRLGDTWNAAKGGSEPDVRTQSAIYRTILKGANDVDAQIILIDLGPNLGALNRAVLGGSDYIIVPVAPDLFSIRGAENLGNKLAKWGTEWDQTNSAWANTQWANSVQIPKGRPHFLGYVTQQYNMRNNSSNMTKGWKIFGDRLESAIQKHIVDRLKSQGQIRVSKNYNLGKIPNLHSLIPYSLEARKPVFHCTGSDGLKGAHIGKAADSKDLFDSVVREIRSL